MREPSAESTEAQSRSLLRTGHEEALSFVAIDFETANYNPRSACSVGLVKVLRGDIVDKAVHLIRPPTRDFVFTYIHKLTWKDVAKSDDFGALWPTIERFLEGSEFLAAHNAAFDKGVLHACCSSYGIVAPSLPFRCTVQIARRTWKIYPTKLPDVCNRLGIALNHHHALSDAMACAQIVLAANRKPRTERSAHMSDMLDFS
jgi:DNA polymerase III subunit epsilon